MEVKSLHMAGFGLHIDYIHKNHHSNAIKLAKNNFGINVPHILVALKYFVLTRTMHTPVLCLHQVYII
jgi:hypothetical protein